MAWNVGRVWLIFHEQAFIFSIQFLFGAEPDTTIKFRYQELGRESIVRIIDKQVGSGIVYFFEVFFSLAIYFIVIVVLQLKEFKNKVEVVVQRIEVICFEDALYMRENIFDRLPFLVHIILLHEKPVVDEHATMVNIETVRLIQLRHVLRLF
jgi:hypothetical protein